MRQVGEPVTAETIRDLTDLIFGWWRSRLIYVGTKLGVFDLVPVGGALNSDAAALALGAERNALYRVMRALAAIGTLRESAGRQFALSPMGTLLRKDGTPSLRDMVLLEDSPTHAAFWSHLETVVREGLPNGVVREYGHDLWVQLARDAAHAEVFNAAMTSYSRLEGASVIEALASTDMASVRILCDVGGGHGALVAALLAAWPQATGVVFDLPTVTASVETDDVDPKIAGRLTFVAGDAFLSVPTADTYMLKHLLHDFDDDECVRILASIRRSATPGARAFVCGFIIPEPNESHFAKIFDVHMLIMNTGRERSVAEYTALLEVAGFRFAAFHPATLSPLGVIQAHVA